MDSVGCGHAKDAIKFDDKNNPNTLLDIDTATNGLKLPTLESLGLGYLDEYKYIKAVNASENSYVMRLNEISNGKDTLTGHWEMMGLNTQKPFKTFFENGFPKELINLIEKECGYKVIGNCAASGTEIIKELGERQLKTKDLIIYTSTDSVLQVAAHEELYGLENIYKICEKIRQITLKDEWKVGRIIARPYLGSDASNFYRTSNRHDYALNPEGETALDILKSNNLDTIAIGKIKDIFNGQGISEFSKTKNNDDGMDKTIDIACNRDFRGLCFVNLVDFDMEFGHRRDVIGYKNALEKFDSRLKELLDCLKDDDLLIITADHGNDPVAEGSDHTRENVPGLFYSKSFTKGKYLGESNSYAILASIILNNYKISNKYYDSTEIMDKFL